MKIKSGRIWISKPQDFSIIENLVQFYRRNFRYLLQQGSFLDTVIYLFKFSMVLEVKWICAVHDLYRQSEIVANPL